MIDIKENIVRILGELPADVKLIAVSKKQEVSKIQQAYDAGQRIFGENYVQELSSKAPALPADIEWHFIGHLQTNKVKQVIEAASWIHSVDSIKLLSEINKQAHKAGKNICCLLQMHIAREESKFGFDVNEVEEMMSDIKASDWNNIRIRGVMGMSSLTADTSVVRAEFIQLRNIFERLRTGCFGDETDFDQISMGMSGDWKIAVEEGSTMVRIGSSIFGARS